jgi:MFS family permease
MAMHMVGLLLVAYANSFAMVAAFAVLHGLAWGIRGPLMQAIRADYFGAGNFGSIMGWSSTIVMAGTISGPLIAGVMADHFGNYQTGFTVIALAAFAGSVFFLLSTKPQPPSRAQTALATEAAS